MTAQLDARAFKIWRYANPRKWDCSIDEIADATGLTYNEVRNTIQRKGWGGRIGRGMTSQQASLREKNKGNRFDVNNLDVVQLMEVSQ